MKPTFLKTLIGAAVATAIVLSSSARPVMFPLKSYFNGSNYTKPVTVSSVIGTLTDGTNLYAGSLIAFTPTGNTNPVVDLAPNNYILAFADVLTPLRFSVSPGTDVVSVVTLITNGLVGYTPVTIGGGYSGAATNINNASGTNVTLTGYFYANGFKSDDLGTYVQQQYYWNGNPFATSAKIGSTWYPTLTAPDGFVLNASNIFNLFLTNFTNIETPILLDGGPFQISVNPSFQDVTVSSITGDGSGLYGVTASALSGPVTNQINSVSGVITNNGLVWYSLKTNGVPAIVAPWGSICTTTNGQLFVRSNTVWLLK